MLLAASVVMVWAIAYLAIDTAPRRRTPDAASGRRDAAATKPTAGTTAGPVASKPRPSAADPRGSAPPQPSFVQDFKDPAPPGSLFTRSSEAARAIDQYFMSEASENPADQEAALERLLRNRHEALKLLEEAYAGVGADVHKERLVSAISDLHTHAAAPFLSRVLREPIREPETPEEGHHDALQSQAVVRYAAMEGLQDLARRGNRAAEDALRDAIVNGHRTLRAEAIAMYLEAGPDLRARQIEVASLLPAEQKFLAHQVNITRREDVPELPRPEGLGTRSDDTADKRDRPPVPAVLRDALQAMNARDPGADGVTK